MGAFLLFIGIVVALIGVFTSASILYTIGGILAIVGAAILVWSLFAGASNRRVP